MTTSTKTKKRLVFKLHAPEAGEVFVAGTFNNWDAQARPLKRDAKGTWTTWMSLPAGIYEYRFVVDGAWQEDPACEDRSLNPHGDYNSVVNL